MIKLFSLSTMSMYTQLAEIPNPTSAQFLSPSDAANPTTIQVTYSVRDHVKNVKRTMSKTIFVPATTGTSGTDEGGAASAPAIPAAVVAGPLVDTDVIAQVVSPSGAKRAVWRKTVSGGGSGSGSAGERIVEVWKGDTNLMLAHWVVTDVHGDAYTDEYLSSFYFSASERFLVYVAEQKAPVNEVNLKDPFKKFRFTPDFGEGLVGKRRPGIFVLRCDGSTAGSPGTNGTVNESRPILVRPVRAVDGLGATDAVKGVDAEEEVRFGQPVFSASRDDVLYATGYEFTQDGRMLGVKGCFNRPSGIWQMQLQLGLDDAAAAKDSEEAKSQTEVTARCVKLTPAHLSCRSPRTFSHFSNDNNNNNNNNQRKRKDTLFWLACKSGGAHLATSTIHALDVNVNVNVTDSEERSLSSSTPKRELVGVVDVPRPAVQKGFPGLYPDYNFAAVPFVGSHSDSESSPLSRVPAPAPVLAPAPPAPAPAIFVASAWGARKTILRVDVSTGKVVDVTPTPVGTGTVTADPITHNSDGDSDKEVPYSYSLLGTDGAHRVLCARSAPSVPYELLLGSVQQSGEVKWRVVDRPTLTKEVAEALKTIKTSILPIAGRGLVETILVQGANASSKPPCITSPHGGPHGSSLTTFIALNTAFVLDGYTVSMPNYTGSPGYGEAFLQGLVGKCGDLDIEDTMASARYLVEQGISSNGPGRQFISGGSHGGFVTAHLIARYPEFFSAAVMRNPVVSAGEISNTDIPDWYFSEFGEDYPIFSSKPDISFSSDADSASTSASARVAVPPLVSVEMFARVQAMSPITAVDAIRTPVLLLIGAADRRVAPSQGIALYHALRARARYAAASAGDAKTPAGARSLKVEMLVFEGEGHPIDGVEASRACAEASVSWFSQAV